MGATQGHASEVLQARHEKHITVEQQNMNIWLYLPQRNQQDPS
jgi:hypothetical protein